MFRFLQNFGFLGNWKHDFHAKPKESESPNYARVSTPEILLSGNTHHPESGILFSGKFSLYRKNLIIIIFIVTYFSLHLCKRCPVFYCKRTVKSLPSVLSE